MSVYVAKCKKTSLRSPLAADGTTVKLESLVDSDGNNVALASFGEFFVLVLKRGTNVEMIKCNNVTHSASGADCTVATNGRSISPITPYTGASTGLDWQTAEVIVTNDPLTMSTFANKKNEETINEKWTFSGNGVLPTQDVYTAPTDSKEFAPKGYVDTVVAGTFNANKLIVAGTAGATVAAGNLVYFDTTDNEWKLCDADTASTVDNVLLGIAQGAGTDGNAIANGVLLFGLDENQSGMTQGDVMFAGNTAGAIVSSAGTTEVAVGIARNTTTLYFAPRFNRTAPESFYDLLVAITASASELNVLDGATGVTAALLTEMATFFASTDITPAEAETLTAGTTSDASTLHNHGNLDTVVSSSCGTASTVTALTYTVAGGTLGTNHGLKVSGFFSQSIGGGGSTQNSYIYLKWNGTSRMTLSLSGSGVASQNGYFEFIIRNNASASAQTYGYWQAFNSGSSVVVTGTDTVDTGSDVELVVSMETSGNSSQSASVTLLSVELLLNN